MADLLALVFLAGVLQERALIVAQRTDAFSRDFCQQLVHALGRLGINGFRDGRRCGEFEEERFLPEQGSRPPCAPKELFAGLESSGDGCV